MLKYKPYIIFSIVVLIGITCAYFSVDNFAIKNPKVIRAKFDGYGGRQGFDGYARYEYQGTKYLEKYSGGGICMCFEKGEEILIKIDSLNPSKLVFIPDTFIAYYDFKKDGKDFFYDTAIAYNLNYHHFTQCLDFEINIEDNVFEFKKFTLNKPRNNEEKMYYIFVNGRINQGFLKHMD